MISEFFYALSQDLAPINIQHSQHQCISTNAMDMEVLDVHTALLHRCIGL